MSRGKKLNIFIGAEIEDGWAKVQTPKKTSVSDEILTPNKHSLFFKKEKRRGKVVTLVGEFHISHKDATSLLGSLKKRLGCGGTYKENFMEFQGEIKEKLRELLVVEGYKIRSGH